jgi:hypothetical protein
MQVQEENDPLLWGIDVTAMHKALQPAGLSFAHVPSMTLTHTVSWYLIM